MKASKAESKIMEKRERLESFHYYLLFPNAILGTGKLMHGSVKKAEEKVTLEQACENLG